jgi:hypothetical protein
VVLLVLLLWLAVPGAAQVWRLEWDACVNVAPSQQLLLMLPACLPGPPGRCHRRRRLSLAHTLALMTRAQAAVGSATDNVDALEAAVLSGQAATELAALSGEPRCQPACLMRRICCICLPQVVS